MSPLSAQAPVMTPVQPKDLTPPHPRAGQAGVIWAKDPAAPDHVGVRWDVDNATTTENVADLNAL